MDAPASMAAPPAPKPLHFKSFTYRTIVVEDDGVEKEIGCNASWNVDDLPAANELDDWFENYFRPSVAQGREIVCIDVLDGLPDVHMDLDEFDFQVLLCQHLFPNEDELREGQDRSLRLCVEVGLQTAEEREEEEERRAQEEWEEFCRAREADEDGEPS